MSGIATAVIGGAIISGVVASKAAKKGSEAITESTATATEEQRRQFDVTQENIQPSIETGNLAREQLSASLGLSGAEAESQFLEGFQESAGQKFLRERGEKSLLRGAASIGGLGGGNVRRDLVEQGIGIAGQRLSERQNRLAALSGTGQTAATNLGQFGQSTATNIGNLALQSGQARASGISGRNQAIQQGIQGITTGLAQSGLFDPSSPPPPVDPFGNDFNTVGGQSRVVPPPSIFKP